MRLKNRLLVDAFILAVLVRTKHISSVGGLEELFDTVDSFGVDQLTAMRKPHYGCILKQGEKLWKGHPLCVCV